MFKLYHSHLRSGLAASVKMTYAATNIEKMAVIIAKSSRSRTVICAPGDVFLPVMARKRDERDAEFWDPA